MACNLLVAFAFGTVVIAAVLQNGKCNSECFSSNVFNRVLSEQKRNVKNVTLIYCVSFNILFLQLVQSTVGSVRHKCRFAMIHSIQTT